MIRGFSNQDIYCCASHICKWELDFPADTKTLVLFDTHVLLQRFLSFAWTSNHWIECINCCTDSRGVISSIAVFRFCSLHIVLFKRFVATFKQICIKIIDAFNLAQGIYHMVYGVLFRHTPKRILKRTKQSFCSISNILIWNWNPQRSHFVQPRLLLFFSALCMRSMYLVKHQFLQHIW